MRLLQPVVIQSFQDGFDLPEGKASNTPAIPGIVMSEGEVKNQVNIKTQAAYQSGVSKLLHVMQWRRPGITNMVRELSRFAGRGFPPIAWYNPVYRVMKYCRSTHYIEWWSTVKVLQKEDCYWHLLLDGMEVPRWYSKSPDIQTQIGQRTLVLIEVMLVDGQLSCLMHLSLWRVRWCQWSRCRLLKPSCLLQLVVHMLWYLR